MTKIVTPSTAQTAFSCPHCGAFTTQHWYKLRAEEITGERETPFIPRPDHRKKLQQSPELDRETKERLASWIDRMVTGLVFFDKQEGTYLQLSVENLHLSKCYNCRKIAVWVNDCLVSPDYKTTAQPNPDLPDD